MTTKVKTLSAGFVVVRDFAAEWRYLLLRCYKLWDFPKGLIEPGESPLEAALREVAEETSLRALELRWGEVCRDTEVHANGKVARYFLAYSQAGDVTLGINPTLGRPEHHAFLWTTGDAAQQILPPRLLPILQWAASLVEAAKPNAN